MYRNLIIVFTSFAMLLLFFLQYASADSIEIITPTPPMLTTAYTAPPDGIHAGNQAIIVTHYTNNTPSDMPVVLIIEVRDSVGITVFLAWQSAMIEGSDSMQVGVSWIPDRPDDYQLRTFVISDRVSPLVLSSVQATDVSIGIDAPADES